MAGAEDYFATLNIHPQAKQGDSVLVVFHRGAKAKPGSAPAATVSAPRGLLEWLGKDRCVARFQDLKDAKVKLPALQAIVRQWIAAV